MDFKKSFLIFAATTVSVIGLMYGIGPSWFAATFLDSVDLSRDFAHILRAMMCLYLALGAFWLFCALKDRHRNLAILTTIVFAGGLVSGRLLSLVLDGLPSPLLLLYTGMEFAIIPVAMWVYKQPD